MTYSLDSIQDNCDHDLLWSKAIEHSLLIGTHSLLGAGLILVPATHN